MADDVDFEEIEFVIPAYTPETMPLDRLLEYLTQIVALVGEPHDMHLIRIDESSTKPVLRMPIPAANRARELTAAVRAGRGSKRQRVAFDTIRRMVRLDGGKPATLKDRTGILIDFEPENMVPPLSLRQPTTFDGLLLRIGGAGDFSAVLMQDLFGETTAGFTAPKPLAKEMAKLLFEPLRLAGTGNWERSQDGEWTLIKMFVQSFEAINDRALEDLLADLQKTQVLWPENADDLLSSERLIAS